MRLLYVFIFISVISTISGQAKRVKIVFDVKLSAVEEMGKKLNVASVYLYQNGRLLDSTVTQTGKCLFNLDFRSLCRLCVNCPMLDFECVTVSCAGLYGVMFLALLVQGKCI